MDFGSDSLDNMKEQLAVAKASVKQYEKELSRMTEKNDDLKEQIVILQAKEKQYSAELERMAEDKKKSSEKIDSLQKQLSFTASTENSLSISNESKDDLKKKIEELENKLKEVESGKKSQSMKRNDTSFDSLKRNSIIDRDPDSLRISDQQWDYYESIKKTLEDADGASAEQARTGIDFLWKDYGELVSLANKQRKEKVFVKKKLESVLKEQTRASTVRENAEATIATLVGVIYNLQDRLESATTLGEDSVYKKPMPFYDNQDRLVGRPLRNDN